jgi:hypothetical protein
VAPPPPPPPGPFTPPTPKPKPKPSLCLALTVTPKLVKVDGKPDLVSVKVTAGKKGVKGVKGVKVLVTAPGVRATGRTNAKGVVVIRVNVKSAGVMRISTLGTQRSCGPKRIGAVGIFLPPLTG